MVAIILKLSQLLLMKKRILFDLVIIFLIGLLPILWLPGDTILLGHDAGYPFDPITHFLDRFSVWSQRLGIGTDQSYGLLGALPIHGLQAFLVWIGLNFKTAQLLVFIFWLLLPGLTMYFFAYKIWPEKKYLPLIASVIYMVNFYLLQAWFVAEQTKFSIYAALPLVAYFALSCFTRGMNLLKSILGTGITLGILNGGGSLPLYGGLIVFFGLATVYFNFISTSFQTLRRTIAYFIGTGVLYVLLSAYWLFPYIYYILGFYSRDLALAGGTEGALGWATYLSKGTSFINLFRGQGVPEWYLNPFHAYASNYLSNPLLILASFIFPLLAYSSLLLVRDKKEKLFILFFVLLSLVTLIFAAGPGSQLSIIFEALTRYVPGFAIFRSAYYKFDYTFYLAFGILIGFTVDWLLTKIERSQILVQALIIIFILGYLAYHSPFLTGSFLDYSHEPGKELSNRITVPQYVFDFGEWANKQDPMKRYLVVPGLSEMGFVAFKWKYWSYAPINSLQTSTSFVQNTFLISIYERFLMNKIYESLLKGDIQSFKDFTEVFAIDGILLQKDFDWQNRFWGTTDPAKYERILDNNPDFKLAETFGEWKVYNIVERTKSLRVTATPRLSFLHGELSNIVSFPQFDSKNPLFMDDSSSIGAYFINEATDVFLSPDCISCNLEPISINFKYYNPKILPGSFLYTLVIFRENLVKKNSKNFNSYLNYLLTASDRRIIEGKWMIDSKTKLNFLEDAFRAYYNSLLELDQFISRENWGVASSEENTAAQTIAAHLEQEAILVESAYDNNLNNINTRTLLASAYDEVLKLHNMVQDRIWITPNTQEKRYLFDLPRLGTYSVYVKENTLADSAALSRSSVAKELKISIPKANKTLKLVDQANGWINFGKADIKHKILKISLKDSTVKNLLDGVSAVLPDNKAGIKIDNGVYTLTTDSQNKCFYFPLNNLETVKTQYIINFSYRNFTDKNDLGFITAEPGISIPKISVKSGFLSNSRQWLNNKIVLPRERYVITPRNPNLNVYFCNGFSTLKESSYKREKEFVIPGQDSLQIKDITVEKISIPSIVLHQRDENIKDDEFVLDFEKPNTVEYKVKVRPTNKPVTLVMRESYGKFWRACGENSGCFSFDDKNHFASAGFENAWYFKNGIKGDVNLYYYPQRIHTIGMYVTIATFILVGGGIWLRFIKLK